MGAAIAAVAVAAATTAATAAAPAVAAPAAAAPLAAGQQGTRPDVPWSRVGPGWMLATRSAARSGGTATLFLIDPAGGRYRLATLPASPARPDYLVDWSGQGQRALLDNSSSPSHVEVLNLRTGQGARFSLGSRVSPRGFSTPGGLAILASTGGARPRLERFSLTGTLQQTYPASFTGGAYFDGNAAVYAPDGNEVAVSTSSAMELISNGGHVIRALPVNSSARDCTPVRWWTATEVLATCFPPRSGIAQLWLVPASGARATALTASPAARGDYGDLDAWPLTSGTYVQDAGACGTAYLAKLQASRQTAPVGVPGVASGDSVIVVGSHADQLAIEARTPCGSGSYLLWYSAAHGTTTPLLGGPASGGGYVDGVFLFGEPTVGL